MITQTLWNLEKLAHKKKGKSIRIKRVRERDQGHALILGNEAETIINVTARGPVRSKGIIAEGDGPIHLIPKSTIEKVQIK